LILGCPSVQQFSFEKTQVYSSSLFSGIETTLTISADLPASGTTSYESMNYFVVTLTDKSNGYFRVPANSEVFTCVSVRKILLFLCIIRHQQESQSLAAHMCRLGCLECRSM
jgi:hypothetical protein